MTTTLILAGIFTAALAAYGIYHWLGTLPLDEIEPPEGDHYPDEWV